MTVAGGTSHDMYRNSTDAVRVMQAADNTDFGIEIKFASEPSQAYQLQGILIEESPNRWLRFDTYHDGSTLYVFSAATTNGSSTQKVRIPVAAGSASYLRVNRQGDNWTFDYSADGNTWNEAVSFNHSLAVTQLGTFAGNAGGTNAPTFTAQLDYFFNSAAPIIPEDTINPLPIAINDLATTNEDTGLLIDVLANDSDPDGETITLVAVTDPANGLAVIDDRGTPNNPSDDRILYTPDPNYNGTDTFTYGIFDGVSVVNGTVTVTVNPQPDPPQAINDNFIARNDINLSGNVLANNSNGADTDPDGDTLTVIKLNDSTTNVGTAVNVVSTGGRSGLLTLNTDGTFIFDPQSNFTDLNVGQSDTVSFAYTISDGNNGEGTATVTINISSPQAPAPVNDTFSGIEDQPITGNLLVDNGNGADTDPNGDPLTVIGGTFTTLGGSVTIYNNGDFIYTPNQNFNGADSFIYTVDDGLETNNATVNISVNPINDAPTIIAAGGDIFFTKQIVDNTMDQTHVVVAADLDGDQDVDMVSTNFVDNIVAWYENDGSQNFTKRVIDNNLGGAYPAEIGDVNNDGLLDVLATGYSADTIVWYENDGNKNFIKRVVDNNADGAHSVVPVDLDDDGDNDLLASNQDAGTITWYENDGSSNFTKYTIDDSALAAKMATFADIDGDGDMDVFAASYGDDIVAWHENDGNENFTKRVIDSSVDGAYFVYTTDIDQDNDADVISASRLDNTIALYRNDGSGNFTQQILDTNARGARSAFAADIDGDGNIDILAASVDDDTVAWYRNDGEGGFTKEAVDNLTNGAYGVFATDVDGDGLMDVLSAGRDDYTVAVHYQRREGGASLTQGSTLIIASDVLQAVDVDNTPGELIYTVDDLPDFGQLRLNNISLGVNGTFTQDDINNLRVSYAHNGTGTNSDAFAFTLSDGANSVNATFTLTIL